jgi:hypothetical protein
MIASRAAIWDPRCRRVLLVVRCAVVDVDEDADVRLYAIYVDEYDNCVQLECAAVAMAAKEWFAEDR